MQWLSQHAVLLTAVAILALLIGLSIAFRVLLGWGWFWSTSPLWISAILFAIFAGYVIWLIIANLDIG